MTGDNVAALTELSDIVGVIGPNALAILLDQARGLRKGVPYGDFEDDGRDQPLNASEEARDGVTYVTDAIRKIRRDIEQTVKGGDYKSAMALTNRLVLLKETRTAFRLAQRLLLQVKRSAEQPEIGGGE